MTTKVILDNNDQTETSLNGSTPEKPRREKEQAILAAALELFSERGFDGTAVPLIAERAGVGAGTIYRYFENKEALVNVLYKDWKTLFFHYLIGEFPAEEDFRVQFHHIWRQLTRFATEYPLALNFLENHHHASYLTEENKQLTENLMEFMGRFIDAYRGPSQSNQLPAEALIAMLMGCFTGLAKNVKFCKYGLTDEVLDAAEEACWKLLAK